MRIRVCCVIALGLWALDAPSQSTAQPLTLDQCIELARSAQSNVLIARQQAAIAHNERIQARADFMPQTFLGGLFAYNSPLAANPATFSFIALNAVREYSTTVNVALDLETSGRLRAQLARAKADEAAAAAQIALSERDLKRTVSASYYRLLMARELVQVSLDTLAEAKAFEARTRLLVGKQEAAQADLVKASSQVAFFEQAVNASELESKIANHALASLWTQDVEQPLSLVDTLRDPLPAPDKQPTVTAPYLRRPEFQLLDAQKLGFQADARRARADLLPRLSLVEQYGLDSSIYSLANRGYASFVALTVPIFDWSRARSAARQSQLRAEQVEVSHRVAERAFSQEYRDALARVDMLYSQVATAQKQVKLSEENLRLSRLRYDGGEGLALEVVAAQTQLAQAKTNYFTARANYLNARVDLKFAEGE